MNRIYGFIFFFVSTLMAFGTEAQAQITGGQSAFEFLRLSNSPHISALGGIAPANPDADVSLTLQNPALLNPRYHNQLSLAYNLYYAGISIANMQYGYHVAPLNTDFSLGIQYLNYGKITETDLYGNENGLIHASDFSLNLSASRKYLEHWRYGATLKFAYSGLAGQSAIAALADVGIVYTDTVNLWTFGAVAKNMGFTLKKYNPQLPAEPLPFDLQIGITKQLKNLPLRLSFVGHHLYEWDIRYDNPADKVDQNLFGTPDSNAKEKSFFVDKLFRHINIAAELILAKRITLGVGYNHLHRSELG
ncbi:MAG TPA: type IX secretion system protein PorQ, partial [Arachidicoccus sp.]|nr:type IX secretion system protein PorQ [Arachidicoccus sp.]